MIFFEGSINDGGKPTWWCELGRAEGQTGFVWPLHQWRARRSPPRDQVIFYFLLETGGGTVKMPEDYSWLLASTISHSLLVEDSSSKLNNHAVDAVVDESIVVLSLRGEGDYCASRLTSSKHISRLEWCDLHLCSNLEYCPQSKAKQKLSIAAYYWYNILTL